MLENWRYNRAINANKIYATPDSRTVFFEQEYLTQEALHHLKINNTTSPSDVSKVGSLLMAHESIPGLRTPYMVEVLGMPHAGKTTMLNRYMEELWQRDERNKIGIVKEGASSIKEKHGDLRYTDPFLYSMLSGSSAFAETIATLKGVNEGMRMVVSDRGQIDRRVWRRTLFLKGNVKPEIMINEDQFIHDLENTPIQIGSIIMFMVRPDVSIQRCKNKTAEPKTNPITNRDFLSRLNEQYWRLHWEILQNNVPFRIYTCINAEEPEDKVYERFKYVMDTTLNIHSTYLAALAKAFPKEFDRIKSEFDKQPKKQNSTEKLLSDKLGRKVLIVGGDDMESKDEILGKPFIEGLHIR